MAVRETPELASSRTLLNHRNVELPLAVAIIVMPPATVGIAIKLATNADVVVGLHFAEAFRIIYLGGAHCARAFGNLSARRLLLSGNICAAFSPVTAYC